MAHFIRKDGRSALDTLRTVFYMQQPTGAPRETIPILIVTCERTPKEGRPRGAHAYEYFVPTNLCWEGPDGRTAKFMGTIGPAGGDVTLYWREGMPASDDGTFVTYVQFLPRFERHVAAYPTPRNSVLGD